MTDGTENPPPPVPTFAPGEKVCGNCKLWQPHSIDHRGWVGPCRVQEQRGLFPPSAPICDAFAPRGQATPVARVETHRARTVKSVAPVVVRKGIELDRKSTRLNSSHVEISYAVFCLK